MTFDKIGDPKYIALETFKKNGEGVVTPVWAVAEAGKLYVWTVGDSWKVKRIRNNGHVRIAVSDAQGNPKSEWVEAQAAVLDGAAEEERQRARLAKKYGLQFRMFSLMNKLRRDKNAHVALEIGPREDGPFGQGRTHA